MRILSQHLRHSEFIYGAAAILNEAAQLVKTQ
jgi:hypothetical protein